MPANLEMATPGPNPRTTSVFIYLGPLKYYKFSTGARILYEYRYRTSRSTGFIILYDLSYLFYDPGEEARGKFSSTCTWLTLLRQQVQVPYLECAARPKALLTGGLMTAKVHQP